MPALLLAALLLLPLPGLPTLPPGAQIRLVSPDLKRVYAVFVVKDGVVWPLRRPPVWGEDRPVAVVIRAGRRVLVYPGLTTADDVLLSLPQGQTSLKAVLTQVYGLRWPTPEEIKARFQQMKPAPLRRPRHVPGVDRRRRP